PLIRSQWRDRAGLSPGFPSPPAVCGAAVYLPPRRGLLLAGLDLLVELADHLGHVAAHLVELPVRDLDHAQRRGRPHRGRALLALEQGLLAEHVARAELREALAVALDLRRPVLDRVEVVRVPPLWHPRGPPRVPLELAEV